MMMMIDFKNTIRYEGSTALYTVYTVYTVYYSNCFTLLKQQHICLYICILLRRFRTLLEWVHEFLSKMLTG